MPRQNTQELKANLRQQIQNNIQKWKIHQDMKGNKIPTNRQLERASIEKLQEWVDKTAIVRENIVDKINTKLSAEGRRNQIVRPSGLIFRRHIVPSSGIMFYKKMLEDQKPNQLYKIVVEKTNGSKELFELKDFINWIESYGEQGDFQGVLDIQEYVLGMNGGCAQKKQTIKNLQINDWTFDVESPETKNNDCLFACISKSLGIKKAGKTYRKELGYELGGMISTDELQRISDHCKLNILLYYAYEDQILELTYKSEIETDKICLILLNKNHYFSVTKVIRPEFNQLKNKLDHLTKNIVSTDECNYEKKYEEEFKDFNDIVQYIVNCKKNILIHGMAGVGKSELSRRIKDWYIQNGNQLIITSSTGLSALNIGGQTIHRYIKANEKKGIKVDVLIDEIGFLSGNDFDNVVRLIKNEVRLIMVGDLKQLPPVEQQLYGYFFESMFYNRINNNLTHIELTKVKRQDNQETINIFGKIRDCQYDNDVIKFLKMHKVDRKPNQDEMVISSHRKSVLEYNNEFIQRLEESGVQKIVFERKMQWDMELIKTIFDNDEQKIAQYIGKNLKYLNQEKKQQTLYIGEKVLLTANKLDQNLANGSVGIIVEFNEQNTPVVEFVQKIFNGTESYEQTIRATIEPVTKYKNGSELYSRKIPLIPAYALTIHKSQGMTIKTPLYVDLSGIWNNELLYVALSRVTDAKLLSLKNPPVFLGSRLNLRKNQRVQQYLEENYFETFAYRMIVEDMDKQMEIGVKPNNDILNLNTIYFDFETAHKIQESGLDCQQPYHNDITYYKNKKVVDTQTFEDYMTEESQTNDVAKMSFDYIMEKVKEYEKEYKQIAKLKDRKLKSDMSQKRLKLVTFNGSGFDLYFLLTQILKTEGFTQKYEVQQIFKGNSLVFFRLFSLDKDVRCVVLESFDIYQIVNCSLAKALESYCPDQAEKIKFKNEIIYLAQNRYKNPEILEDKIQRITSIEYVTIKNENEWKMDNLKQQDGWIIEDESIKQLQRISRDPDNINRRYKVNIYKNMNIKKSLMEYAKNDTEVLPILLESLDKICHKIFKCSILHFITAGTLCWYGFQQNAPKEMFAEDIYDFNRNKKTRKHGERLTTNLYKNEFEEEKFCLESIIGGKTCPRMKKLPQIKVSDGIWNNTQNAELKQFIQSLDPDSFLKYVYADIQGMYCDLMLNNLYPYGRKWWLNKTEMESLIKQLKKDIPRYCGDKLKTLTEIKKKVLELHNTFFPCMFIAKVEIDENDISLEPMIAYKQKIGGTEEKPMYKTKFTNKKRIQTLTSIDIITILLKGGNIYGMEKCLMFEKKGYLLRDWMIKCLEIKNQGKKENLPALTSFGKLLANGTYGQTLKQDKQEVIMFVNQQWQTDQFNKLYKFKNAFITDSDFDILIGTKLVNKEKFVTSRCSYIGSFVLAYSRLVIQDICQTFNPEQDSNKQPLVGDTDSLLIREDLVYERLIPAGYMQARSGLLSDELADSQTPKQKFYIPKNKQVFINRKTKKITDADDVEADPNEETWKDIINPMNYKFCLVYEGFFVQPKTLAIEYQDVVNEIHTKIRAKGIPLNACYGSEQEQECLSYKMFVDLLKKSDLNQQQIDELNKEEIKHKITKGEQLQCPTGIKVITPNILNGNLNEYGEETKSNDVKIRKNDALFRVVENNMTRKIFNTEYKGRCISKLDNNIYLPFGHPDAIEEKQQEEIITVIKCKLTEQEQEEYDAFMEDYEDLAPPDDLDY